MKKSLIIWICFGCVYTFAQNLNVYDLYIIQENNDINQVNYFLVKYKDFEYIGHLGVDEDGWDNYKFSKDGNDLIVGTASIVKDGQFYELTSVLYTIYDSNEYDLFINSLIINKFKKGERDYNGDGIPFIMWSGTRDLKDMLRLVTIFEEKNKHSITII